MNKKSLLKYLIPIFKEKHIRRYGYDRKIDGRNIVEKIHLNNFGEIIYVYTVKIKEHNEYLSCVVMDSNNINKTRDFDSEADRYVDYFHREMNFPKNFKMPDYVNNFGSLVLSFLPNLDMNDYLELCQFIDETVSAYNKNMELFSFRLSRFVNGSQSPYYNYLRMASANPMDFVIVCKKTNNNYSFGFDSIPRNFSIPPYQSV